MISIIVQKLHRFIHWQGECLEQLILESKINQKFSEKTFKKIIIQEIKFDYWSANCANMHILKINNLITS